MKRSDWQRYQRARRSNFNVAGSWRGLDAAEAVCLRIATLAMFNGLPGQSLVSDGDTILGYLITHARALGIDHATGDLEPMEMGARKRAEVIRHLLSLITVPRRQSPPSALQRKLAWLGDTLAFSLLEREMIALFVRATHFRPWKKLLEASSFGGRFLNVEVINRLCDASAAEIDRALMPGAALLRGDLIIDDGDGDYRLGLFVNRLLAIGSTDPEILAAHMLPPAAPASIAWEDFAHVAARDMARATVHAAASAGQGVDILLHGLPGTGKSEFARALAEHCGLTAVFAGLSDEQGAEPTRSERLSHLNVLRALTERSAAHMIVVDEADDVLSIEGEGRQQRSKLWINRLVEDVRTPTIWITNNPHALGETTVRRMHLAIGFDLPPASVRARVLARAAAKQDVAISAAETARIAQLPAAPAVLANAVAAAHLSGGGADAVERAANGILEALGERPGRIVPLPAVYDPSLALADQDLSALADRLARAPGRGWSLLLAGPSGTGKSAFARHLAERLGIEVEERRGSDLLDPYVGGTEAKIARAFRTAADRGALLLIDEADSFLFDRRSAKRSWEGSMVNEMLRWMEHHPAPFIATTNLADTLDPASQRRFTLTVRFRPLTPMRAAALFAAQLGVALPAATPPLEGVTPGDVAVVAKRAALLGERDPATLAAWLQAEVEARGTGKGGRTGFHLPALDTRFTANDLAGS